MSSRSSSVALAALVTSGLLAPVAHAKTRVFVQNNTPLYFGVTVTRTGYPLASSKWGQTRTSIAPNQSAEVLWFNRDDGIKKGQRFHFFTRLTSIAVPVPIELRQSLLGKTINSHMWQSLHIAAHSGCPAVAHPWSDDRQTRYAWVNGKELRVLVKYRAFATGTDDHIEYILHPRYMVPPSSRYSLNLLTYNIYMRPTSLFSNGQEIRARLLPSELSGYDVIVFSEAFDDDVRCDLLSRLRPEYPHQTRILGSDRGFEQDGGVIMVSRWPIESPDQRLFKGVSSGSDAMADKGVLYACINKSGFRYHIFGSHTQADAGAKDIAVRRAQFRIIRDFIRSKNIPKAEPVIIAGDLNVDMYHYGQEYKDMLTTLNAVHPARRGHPYTCDPMTNGYASGKRQLLDYALYSKAHLQPTHAHNEVRMIRSPQERPVLLFSACCGVEDIWSRTWDLSDHYAVFGRFDFPLPAPERGTDHGPIHTHRAPAAPDKPRTHRAPPAPD